MTLDSATQTVLTLVVVLIHTCVSADRTTFVSHFTSLSMDSDVFSFSAFGLFHLTHDRQNVQRELPVKLDAPCT